MMSRSAERFGRAACAALLGLSALFGAACAEGSVDDRAGSATALPHDGAAPAPVTTPESHPAQAHPAQAHPAEPPGDVARGEELVAKLECARCHDGTEGVDAALPTKTAALDTKHCFSCHADILDGRLDHKADAARWKKNVAHLVAAPSLTSIGARLDYGWVVRYLEEPHDLRPNLSATMPRMDIDKGEARDIASYLASLGEAVPAPEVELAEGDASRGKKRIDELGCATCHRLGGAPLSSLAGAGEGKETRVAVMLAPDLRHARERWSPAALVQWIRDPLAMKPDTKMPQTPMSEQDALDVAAYLMTGELAPAPAYTIPALPPVLDRAVTYGEVAERVLDKTCRHCHGDPDVALGDGGPGNTGGFGFPARGLELTSYARVSAGYLDDEGERHSVFAKMDDGTPRLVVALLARHAEVAGEPNPEVRGMPLGLPPLPIEDIQLVATWIAQGRPR